MLSDWLIQKARSPCPYTQFGVVDISETGIEEQADSFRRSLYRELGQELMLAHGEPLMIRHELNKLLKNARELGLDAIESSVEQIITKYLDEEILPGDSTPLESNTRIGNFGEILAAKYLLEFEEFWFPILKLRFRQKRSRASQLTDLCVIKTKGLEKPLVCYSEVKTKTSNRCDKNVAIEGHNSLRKDDALKNPEILRFCCSILFQLEKFEEADLLSDIRLNLREYSKQHTLFLVHEKATWDEEILERLEASELDSNLVDFRVYSILIDRLREVIDMSYKQCWKSAAELLDE